MKKKSNSDVKLLHEPQNKIIQLEGDKNPLSQVISNLLGNAIKFTKKGTIRVTVEIKDSKTKSYDRDTMNNHCVGSYLD